MTLSEAIRYGPPTLDRRLGVIRRRRRSLRMTSATTAVLWLVGLGTLMAAVGGGLLTSR